jgi:hypothetical protein
MSNRYVWPYIFSLRGAGLVEAARQQKVGPVRDQFFKSNGLFPIALRWSTAPLLGFPREPFQVFRRRRGTNDKKLYTQVAAAQALNGQHDIQTFPSGDLAYIVSIPLTLAAGNSVTVQAFDNQSRAIPGQTLTISGTALVEIRCPGIAFVRLNGTASVGAVSAAPETAYANLPDWQRIQTVGLPLKNGEIGANYNTLPQGFEPPTLDGIKFAEIRTTITAMLQVNPQNTGIADFPLPPWPSPDPIAYVANIRAPKSLVPMIERCLTRSVDTDPARLQAEYVETVQLAGIHQASLPGATANPGQTTNAKLPIPGVAMMAASTDSYSAVSLGYGTVDIPPVVQTQPPPATVFIPTPVGPAIDNFGGYDYMVTAPFTFPFGLTVTLAALIAGDPPVQPPAGLAAKVKQVHAPVKRNQPAPAVINVNWQPATIPQGYGILTSRAPNQSEVLNAQRPSAVKGFDPFIGIAPTNPDPNTPPDQQIPNFSDTACQLPLKNPAITDRYLVAGLDVFGLWTGWNPASASLSPAPVTKPGIRNVEFLMDPAHAAGHSVPATLRIEFAWDWADRAPGQIRFTGNFVVPGAGLGPAPFLSGLAMQNFGAAGPAALLTFNYASAAQADTVAPTALIPTIDAGHTTDGPVHVLQTSNPDPNSTQVQYRVDIQGFTLSFAAVNEIDLALYITASEFIRPGEFSDATDPVMKFVGKVAKAFDPIPPVVNFSPPSISWTALPDATGMARGILQWTPDPKATGYYVWEATESALRHLLEPPGTPDPAPSTPLVNRGGALKTLVMNNQDKSLQGFARLNKDPITGSRTEIRVPAAASTLYVYRVSAISAANVEAARSPQIAVFGVPRRNVPGTPRILLRSSKSPQGVQVIAIPVESGAAPAGYRVFRVRNHALSLDGSTMGPAKLDESNPAWQDYNSTTLAGKPLHGKLILDTAATASWFPYYYRIKAIGAQDVGNGQYSGESDFSLSQQAYVTPANPPLILLPVKTNNATAALVTLKTDLPADAASPLGPALVEVLQFIPDPANPGKLETKNIISHAPESITVGSLTLPVAPPPGPPHPPHPPFPPIPPHPLPVAPKMARSAPTNTGQFNLFVLIPYKAADAGTFMIRLTDPLKRQSTYSL